MEQALNMTVGGLLQGSAFAVVALGLSLIFRVTGVINLAQGSFCILGALTFHTLSSLAGLPLPLAALLAVAATTAVGFALGAAVFVPALDRLPNSGMLMMTVGLMTLLEGFAIVVWGSEPYAIAPFSGEAPLVILGLRVPTQGLWIAGVSAAIVAASGWGLARTATGKALLACAENPVAAQLLGIDVRRLTVLSFALTALIGAVGGIAVAPIMSVQYDTGRFFTNAGFIAVVIGGLGSLVGAVAGGLLLGVAQQLAAGYVSTLFSTGLALGLLLVALLLRPQGLFAVGPAPRGDVRKDGRVHGPIVRFAGRGSAAGGLLLLGVLALLPVLVDSWMLSSCIIVLILFIAVLGLDVVMGYTGQVNLGQAGFMAIGGYAAAILATDHGWSPLPATLAGAVLALVVAVALALVTIRLRGIYLALATLTFGLLVDSLAVGLTGVTGGPSGLVGIPSFRIGAVEFATPEAMYYLVLGIVVLLLAALSGLVRSSFGRALQAIRTDQLAAGALAIDVVRHKIAAFAISAVLGSLAGSLYAFHFHFLAPEMVGTARSFELIAMLVIGGEGTLFGGLVGAALITLMPTIFQPLAAYKVMAEGLLLVLVFRYLPEGLLGAVVHRLGTIGFNPVRKPRSAPVGDVS